MKKADLFNPKGYVISSIILLLVAFTIKAPVLPVLISTLAVVIVALLCNIVYDVFKQ